MKNDEVKMISLKNSEVNKLGRMISDCYFRIQERIQHDDQRYTLKIITEER